MNRGMLQETLCPVTGINSQGRPTYACMDISSIKRMVTHTIIGTVSKAIMGKRERERERDKIR